MKREMPFLSKWTAAGLIAVAIALWGQWLSGDPAYPTFPPGPILFMGVAAIVIWGARWWWTPLIGALISILVTFGWFARLQGGMLRLEHPGHVGRFAAGIFLSTALQISALLLTDIAGLAATVQNFRRAGNTNDIAKMACRFFGGLFAAMGVLAIVAGTRVDKYHNLMHLLWGVLAFGCSFLSEAAAKRFCIASGAFYLTVAALGLSIGNPALNHAWHFGPMLLHTGDHIFHLVLGSIFLAMGLLSGRQLARRPSHA